MSRIGTCRTDNCGRRRQLRIVQTVMRTLMVRLMPLVVAVV